MALRNYPISGLCDYVLQVKIINENNLFIIILILPMYLTDDHLLSFAL